ncbi:MAG: hypothetical protein AB1758_00945 [Candidatus Eremiobacterota bacterium]
MDGKGILARLGDPALSLEEGMPLVRHLVELQGDPDPLVARMARQTEVRNPDLYRAYHSHELLLDARPRDAVDHWLSYLLNYAGDYGSLFGDGPFQNHFAVQISRLSIGDVLQAAHDSLGAGPPEQRLLRQVAHLAEAFTARAGANLKHRDREPPETDLALGRRFGDLVTRWWQEGRVLVQQGERLLTPGTLDLTRALCEKRARVTGRTLRLDEPGLPGDPQVAPRAREILTGTYDGFTVFSGSLEEGPRKLIELAEGDPGMADRVFASLLDQADLLGSTADLGRVVNLLNRAGQSPALKVAVLGQIPRLLGLGKEMDERGLIGDERGPGSHLACCKLRLYEAALRLTPEAMDERLLREHLAPFLLHGADEVSGAALALVSQTFPSRPELRHLAADLLQARPGVPFKEGEALLVEAVRTGWNPSDTKVDGWVAGLYNPREDNFGQDREFVHGVRMLAALARSRPDRLSERALPGPDGRNLSLPRFLVARLLASDGSSPDLARALDLGKARPEGVWACDLYTLVELEPRVVDDLLPQAVDALTGKVDPFRLAMVSSLASDEQLDPLVEAARADLGRSDGPAEPSRLRDRLRDRLVAREASLLDGPGVGLKERRERVGELLAVRFCRNDHGTAEDLLEVTDRVLETAFGGLPASSRSSRARELFQKLEPLVLSRYDPKDLARWAELEFLTRSLPELRAALAESMRAQLLTPQRPALHDFLVQPLRTWAFEEDLAELRRADREVPQRMAAATRAWGLLSTAPQPSRARLEEAWAAGLPPELRGPFERLGSEALHSYALLSATCPTHRSVQEALPRLMRVREVTANAAEAEEVFRLVTQRMAAGEGFEVALSRSLAQFKGLPVPPPGGTPAIREEARSVQVGAVRLRRRTPP